MSLRWNEIRDEILQAIAWVVFYAPVATSSDDGQSDEVEGRSESNEPQYQIPVRRLWPFGIRSRPPAGVQALVVNVNGGSTKGVMLGAESSGYGPSDLKDGETAIYSKALPYAVFADENGKVLIGASTGLQPAVRGDTLWTDVQNIKADLDALRSFVSTHTHAYTAGVAPYSSPNTAGIATTDSAPTIHTPTDPRSSVVEVK